MLSWSVRLFRVQGIQLAVHGSFFLLLAYVAWEGWREAGASGMAWTTLTVLAFFGCVVLHELGHCFAAMRFGVGVRRILLMPIGGMAEFTSIPRQPGRELLITIAGPAVNFVLAAGLWLIARDVPDDVAMFSAEGLVVQLLFANLIMGCFNLIPAFPMDGGRLLRAALAIRMPYLRATRWAANLGKVVCASGVVFGLTAHALGLSPEPLWLMSALFAFIFVAGELEYRAAERREREDAHWREVLARFHITPNPTEPPLLSPE